MVVVQNKKMVIFFSMSSKNNQCAVSLWQRETFVVKE
jgi:hypothetical protein